MWGHQVFRWFCQWSADWSKGSQLLQFAWGHYGIFFTTNSHVFSDPPNHWNGIRLNCFDLFPIRHCTIQCSIYAHLNDISCHDRSLDLHWWWGWCLTFVFFNVQPLHHAAAVACEAQKPMWRIIVVMHRMSGLPDHGSFDMSWTWRFACSWQVLGAPNLSF